MVAWPLVAFMMKAVGASPIETPPGLPGGPSTEVDTGDTTGAVTAAAPMFGLEDELTMGQDESGPTTMVPDETAAAPMVGLEDALDVDESRPDKQLSRQEIREIMGGDNPWNPSGEWDPPPPGMEWATVKRGDIRANFGGIPAGITLQPPTTTSTPWEFTGSTPEGVIPLRELIDGLGPFVDRKEALKRLAPYYGGGGIQRESTTPRINCSENMRSARLC